MEKQKCLNLWPKMPYLHIFDEKSFIWIFLGYNFKKSYCHIWNQHPQICLFAKFHGKTKMPKFGTKNAWFGYFWTGIWKQFCHIWNQHPQISLIAKFCEKTKEPTFGTKYTLTGYFLPRILKKYCYIWNQHPQICQKCIFKGELSARMT